MRMVWWIMPRIGLDTYSFKDKTTTKTEKSGRKPKSSKGKMRIGGRGMHSRATTMGGGCPGCFSRFLNITFCTCHGLHALPMLGQFGRFLLSSFIHMTSKTFSNHMFWTGKLEFCETHKTTHNRRNRGINRIIIYFKPLKWLLNT